MTNPRKIEHLVVHCTATSQATSVASLLTAFKARGWSAPGYHYVITPDGKLHELLSPDRVSNGVRGHNATSIHVAYIGGIDRQGKGIDNRTPEQKVALLDLLRELKRQYPTASILGHRDFSPDQNGNGIVDPWERIKECPCFDAIPEYKDL